MSTSVTSADPAVSRLRLIALVAGVIGIVACALTPLLPVTTTGILLPAPGVVTTVALSASVPKTSVWL